ncbi:hypothetical protein CCY99_04720 [Helicobacter sp. 16-1353]|nr:hypothetical protein CCY99_04720 [Helicobacter sp. 16-1353]
MNVADLIVEFLIQNGIKDIFGYPGGMVIHLINALDKRKDKITNHINYHEQGSSFAACGYSLASRNIGVAYATSGPGATNLITGIANAYFDSIPCLFITGNVNIDESKGNLPIRQKGFQEMDIIPLLKNCTKYATYINDKNEILYELQKSLHIAKNGRCGAVVLDIPMNIFKENIDLSTLRQYEYKITSKKEMDFSEILAILKDSKRPCIIAGMGVNPYKNNFLQLLELLQIPIILSMPNIDLLPTKHPLNFGFLGAYGLRMANFIIHKSDVILSIGSRLDIRQIGAKKENFAPNAKLIRIDIDENEFINKIKENELQIHSDCGDFIDKLAVCLRDSNDFTTRNYMWHKWLKICKEIRQTLKDKDARFETKAINAISKYIPNNAIITTDVGQNQVWVAQCFNIKDKQRILFSSSFGAMGCSLPMAIGAYFGSKDSNISQDSINTKIYCICGDGGFQMNIQELEFIRKEKLPIKIIIINNKSLGMIRHFQEIYFDKNYVATTKDSGYSTPNFKKITKAYGLKYFKIIKKQDIKKHIFSYPKAAIIEVIFDFDTYVFPKLEFNKPNCDQLPPLERKLYQYLLNL